MKPPHQRLHWMRKVNFLPNIITAFGLACGLFVIFKVNMIEPGSNTYQMLQTSVILLLIAAFADVIDGAVARLCRSESEFGAAFDSLSDAISFGVAPSVLLLKSLTIEQGTTLSFFAILSAMLFSLCGVLRLVRFNVKASEAKSLSELEQQDYKKHFTGLPIPSGAMAAVSATFFLYSPIGERWLPMSETTRTIVLLVIMVVLGYFMISRWKFPSIKTLHFRVPSFQLILATVVSAIVILYGVLYFFPIILLAVSWSYVLLGWTLSLIRLIAGKKSKTLKDFEPEDLED